jgi:hypothetical protein
MTKYKPSKRERRFLAKLRNIRRAERIAMQDFRYYHGWWGFIDTYESEVEKTKRGARKIADTFTRYHCRCDWCFPDPSVQDERSRLSYKEELQEIQIEYSIMGYRILTGRFPGKSLI